MGVSIFGTQAPQEAHEPLGLSWTPRLFLLRVNKTTCTKVTHKVSINYHEANGCDDLLAKQGTRQQPLVCVYSSCLTFVTVAYIRDLTGLGETRLCTSGAADDVIWTSFYLNNTSRFPSKKKSKYKLLLK